MQSYQYFSNFVGSWNDGDISRGLQDKLLREDINLPGYGKTTDTAFPVAGDLFGRIMTPLKEGDEDRIPPNMRPYALRLSSAVTRIRQAAEWGMGAVGKVYRILERKLPYNLHIRGRRLKNLIMLYNYRVRTTEISQIRSVFLVVKNLACCCYNNNNNLFLIIRIGKVSLISKQM